MNFGFCENLPLHKRTHAWKARLIEDFLYRKCEENTCAQHEHSGTKAGHK